MWFIRRDYIAVLAKIQFFKISVIFWRFVFFYLFFSCQLFSAIFQPIYTKFSTGMSSCMWLKNMWTLFQKFKNQVTTAKKHRFYIGIFFTPAFTFSLVVTKRLKFFGKPFLRWHLERYTFLKMSSWQFKTIQFSQTLGSIERQKGRIWRLFSKT